MKHCSCHSSDEQAGNQPLEEDRDGKGVFDLAAGGRRRENSDFVYECVLACFAAHDIWIWRWVYYIVGLQEYFYDQMLDSIKSLAISLILVLMCAS